MTHERWKQTEDLYHAARSRPLDERTAFLAEACPDDDALRREVESLLNEPPSGDGLLDRPAPEIPAHLLAALAPGAMTGRAVAGYRLEALLGAGGMGEVYRARDPKLGRDVAIKVLPRGFASDPERLARFEREARLLATLNHPHIGSIYGLEEGEGVRALVLELVEGETLAERITREAGLPLTDALAIARQIADALDAAHEKGIVHRDVKPANIKIKPDGFVKVLDFGLAKAASGDAARPDPTASRHGALIGTVAYMSPEQARGQSVDRRADTWAFGCVLYEMLTGRLAFAGDTVSDTIAQILEREPDWSALPATTPARIRRLLLRCLAKDLKRRQRDMGDARIEIDAIDEAVPGGPDATVPPLAGDGARGTTWLPWVALAALAAAVGAWALSRPAITQENPLDRGQFTFFTNWEGSEGGADISPDGKFVAFLADRAGEVDLWVSQVGTGRFDDLTLDVPPLDGPQSDQILRTFGFSGDGAEIWFSPAGNASGRKILVPLTGGAPRVFLGQGAAAPSWSPDGTRLVYFNNGAGDRLLVADGAGGDAHEIPITPTDLRDWSGVTDRPGAEGGDLRVYREGLHNHNPIWSPDSQWIYFTHGAEPTEDMDVWRVRPSGGSPERLTHEHAALNLLAALSPRTLLYVARAEDRSGPWLWALDVERRSTRRVTSGVEQYTSVAASRDGRRIVATVANSSASLWRVPLGDRLADDRDAQPYPLPMPTGRAMAPRFGGTSLFYLSARGTRDGLWKVQDGQASEVWRDQEGSLSEPPAVSPDGQRLAVGVRREGKRHLSIMAADGSTSETLAPSIDIQGATGQGAADWSPDGTWIVAGGRDAQGRALFKIPVDGGAPVRLVEGAWANPVWSPDGRTIVYTGPLVGGVATLLGVRPDGAAVELPPVQVRQGGYRFLPDGTGLVYLPRIQSVDFWLLDFTTKKTRPLTRLSNQGALRTFDITPDGRHIVFDRSRENSNVVLIELPSR